MIKRTLMVGMATMALVANAASPPKNTDTVSLQLANTSYRNAIEDARAGRLEQALGALKSLVEQFPGRQDMLGDYAVVLGWAGRHAEALALLDRIMPVGASSNTPAFVIDSLANSARRVQQFDIAESLYRESMARFPAQVEAQIGLARTLADAGKRSEATVLINSLRTKYPHRADVLEAAAEISAAGRDYFAELATYQSLLAQQPANRDALHGKIMTLAHIGLPQLAIELADRNPDVISAAERQSIAADITAHHIRWGSIAADTGRGSARFALLDQALAESSDVGTRALDPTITLSPIERQVALDRIVGLQARYRMRDTVALYVAMAARPQAVPAYAKSAAASAYLYLQHPEQARDLYREALVTEPDNLESQLGLFYALSECEQHEAALKQVEHTVAITPPTIDAWSPATIRENPAYPRVLSARAMAPLLANQPGESEQRLHELSDRAPYNMEIRTDYASSMRARGWPRTAEEELRWILAVDPDNSGALGERAGALLEMRDYQRAESALASAQTVSAEDGRVVRAARLAQVNDMRELIVDGTFGRSSGGPSGTRDYAIESWLYSSPIDYNYRVFGHLYNAEDEFVTGNGRRNRAGVGVEYRSPLITASGEVSHDVSDSKTGGAVSLAYTPDDYWTFRGTFDSLSNETPLQATFVGINAHRTSGEVIWQANESRSAAVSYEQLDFSDGNRRNAIQGSWTERVIAGPVYQLEVTGGLYASQNSLAGTPYFNPSHDFSPTLEFTNEWLQWRRYTRSFRHRLILTVGSYQQEGFGTGPVAGVRYEQEWEADDRFTFRYGIGRGLHPYDGAQSGRNYGYFYLDWRF